MLSILKSASVNDTFAEIFYDRQLNSQSGVARESAHEPTSNYFKQVRMSLSNHSSVDSVTKRKKSFSIQLQFANSFDFNRKILGVRAFFHIVKYYERDSF